MAGYVKFNQFVEDLASKVHDLQASGDTLRIYLTNATPNIATDAVKADIAGITEQNGYTTKDIQNDISRSGGTLSLTGADFTWTATGGSFGPFRYIVLYNDTPTSPADPLIAYWDYGATVTINDGGSFPVTFGASIFDLA